MVSEQDVDRVAELANLELTGDERTLMKRDLNSILDYVVQLNELDTVSVPPMTQVADQLADENGLDSKSVHLRFDTPAPSLNRDQVMPWAPDTDRVFFKVPKVIER